MAPTPTKTLKAKAKPVDQPVVDGQKVEAVEETPFDVFIDHQKKAIVEAGKALEGLLPENFKDHGQTAFKEVLEGYRSLFNATIDELMARIEKVRWNEDKK